MLGYDRSRLRALCLLASAAGALASQHVLAETVQETAARFGAREAVLSISMSPSGNKVAFVGAGPRGTETLSVIDLGGDKAIKTILSNTEVTSDLVYCDWATESRLVCEVRYVADDAGTLIGFSRLFAVGDDGTGTIVLTPRTSSDDMGIRQDGGDIVALDLPGAENRILMTRWYVPQVTMGRLAADDTEGLGVEWVDVVTGKRGRVEPADREAAGFIADGEGNIRLKTRIPASESGMQAGRFLYFFREPGSSKWQPLSQVRSDGAGNFAGYLPVAVDGREGVSFGFDTVNGFDAIIRVPLVTNGRAEVVASRKDVDVDSLIRIGRQRRVVGASFATEKRQVEYFDPELQRLAASLRNALPGKPLINIVGASADEGKLLIAAASDTDPGTIYLYDKATKRLGELLPVRRQLRAQAMAAMQPVTFPARDGTQIPGYLTLPPGSDGKNLPAIVLPHGGPSARDEWGFDWLVQFFAARGYAVLQPNYRGSSGYGNAWFGKNGFRAWSTAIGDVNDAGKWLVSQGIAKPQSLAIVGWSYGGYAALQSQVVDPALFKAVVAIAPVTDLERLRDDHRPFTNFRIIDEMIGSGDHVQAGSPARHADRFSAPVLLVHGTRDQSVRHEHSRLMHSKLKASGKPVEYLQFDYLGHSLGDSAARTEMLIRADAFLASSLGK